MTSQNLLHFLREWATMLNTHCKAGALVDVCNDVYTVRIKNKAFTPFIACLSIGKNGCIQMQVSEAFDYRKSIQSSIYGSGEACQPGNYRFCEATLSGSVGSLESLLSAMLASAANHFFSQSKYDLKELPTLIVCR